jgi:deazaflavin-dependent oxidoreductase (nitroreductase family)
MPLGGEYQPSRTDRTREQVKLSEATNGVEGGTLKGKLVIVLTFKGAKSDKIRKTPLMRIEHNGTYAVVASNAGAPVHPFWYRDIVANPLVELQDGVVKHEMRTREIFGQEKNGWWKRANAAYSGFPAHRPGAGLEIRCSSWSPSRLNDGASLCRHCKRSRPGACHEILREGSIPIRNHSRRR